ncbi:MAG: hypothetical protein OXE84_10060 [Rhodobacteraceae bacterium]|nr:hypothetical protein [Paracoccaceae bacterium]MCY4326792.1 hypothetical protein [Paracoccaceae bacterium]
MADSRPTHPRPNEAEILRLLEEAAQQYEDYTRLADLADLSSSDKRTTPRYAWDNPIGLMAAGR